MAASAQEKFPNELAQRFARAMFGFGGTQAQPSGFGFVIGETDDQLFLLTPDHVLRQIVSGGNPVQGQRVTVWTRDSNTPNEGVLIAEPLDESNEDAGVVVVPRPQGFAAQPVCVAPLALVGPNDKAWFLGQNWDGQPEPGTIGSTDGLPSFKFQIENLKARRGDSGGPAFTERGVIGFVKEGTLVRSNVTRIYAVIPYLQKALAAYGYSTWVPSACSVETRFSLRATQCFTTPSKDCWPRIPYEAWLAGPSDWSSIPTTRTLAWQAAAYLEDAAVSNLLDLARTPSAKAAAALGGAWGALRTQRTVLAAALAKAGAEAAVSIEKPEEKVEALSELIAIFGTMGNAEAVSNTTALAERSVLKSDASGQLVGRFHLAFFAALGGQKKLAWQQADEMAKIAKSISDADRLVVDGIRELVADSAIGASRCLTFAGSVAPAELLYSLRPLTRVWPEHVASDQVSPSSEQAVGLTSILYDLAARAAACGQASVVQQLARQDYAWWWSSEPSDSVHPRYFTYERVAYALQSMRLYEDARQWLTTDLVYDIPPDDWDKVVKVSIPAVMREDEIFALAESAIRNRYKGAGDIAKSARDFSNRVNPYRGEHLELQSKKVSAFLRQAELLVTFGYVDDAAEAYWEIISHLVYIETLQARSKGAGFLLNPPKGGVANLDTLAPTTDYSLDSPRAFILGIDLPMAIAEGYHSIGDDVSANYFRDIAERFATFTIPVFPDEASYQRGMARIEEKQTKAPERANLFFYRLAREAPDLFKRMPADAPLAFAIGLVRMGDPVRALTITNFDLSNDTATKATADTLSRLFESTFEDVSDFREVREKRRLAWETDNLRCDVFWGYAAKNMRTQAEALLAANPKLDCSEDRRLWPPDAPFAAAWALAAVRVGQFDLVEGPFFEAVRANPSNNELRAALEQRIVWSLEKQMTTAARAQQAGALCARLALAAERDAECRIDTADALAEHGDPKRAVGILGQLPSENVFHSKTVDQMWPGAKYRLAKALADARLYSRAAEVALWQQRENRENSLSVLLSIQP